MAELQNFRSAFNGFNREDVVHYIEYLNTSYANEVNRLKTQCVALENELTLVRGTPGQEQDLAQALEASQRRCEELARENEELRRQTPQVPSHELEAYRRAERMERMAQVRADRVYRQTNSILAQANSQVDDAAERISAMAQETVAQLEVLRTAVLDSKNALQEASVILEGLKTEETPE